MRPLTRVSGSKVLAPPGNIAASDRIRARLRPTRLSRIIDPVVEWGEKWYSRTRTTEPAEPKWLYESAGPVAFFSFMFALFILGGKLDMAAHFFGTLAAAAFGIRAYHEWARRHPLPPVHLRSARHDLGAVAHGLVHGSLFFGLIRIVNGTLIDPQSISLSFSLLVGGVVAVGIYLLRTEGPDPEKPRRSLLGVAAWLGATLIGFWIGRLPLP